MTKYESDVQFTRDVMSIRHRLRHNDSKLKHILYKLNKDLIPEGGNYIVCDYQQLFSKSGLNNNNSVDAYILVHISHREKNIMYTNGGKEFEVLEYDEGIHFQHSLIYSDFELRMMMVSSALSLYEYNHDYRFRIAILYIPIITKLLRYSNYGII